MPRYGSACPQSASDLGGRFQIKVTIKSADQKTADFASEKDVRAVATATAEPNSVKGGSGLARESGVSVNSSVTDTPLSRASPLPHFDRVASGK
ncbi:hypothetical protein FFI16_013965 [Pseudomonas sp. KBS0710]|nr:hypothetical protein FFI16_013965 [Pseudomonas sp. KBS0710]